MPTFLYLLWFFCGFGFGIQSYFPHPDPTDDLITVQFKLRLDAREQEFLPKAALIVSEEFNPPVSSKRFEYNVKGQEYSPKSDQLSLSNGNSSNQKVFIPVPDPTTRVHQGQPDNDGKSHYRPTPALIKFRFGIVADLDEKSIGLIALGKTDPRASRVWVSDLREGVLSMQKDREDGELYNITVEWNNEPPRLITSGLNYGGRGMELSTLNIFDGKLLACDDKTGVIYELPIDDKSHSSEILPRPWVILPDLNSTIPKGFQCEWATVKDEELWIGSHGINELNEHEEVTEMPKKFIHRVTPDRGVTTLNWSRKYDKMSKALYIPKTGYVRHEAGLWSDIHQKWIFMPRRVSKEKYEPHSFARSGSNVVILADENFKNAQVRQIGDHIPTHGFTDSKFVPGTEDQVIVALKVVETELLTETYITAFDLNGNVLLPETKLADKKYEGIEFL